MKASIAYKTLDNITVVMLAFKNFKKALVDEFCQVNGLAGGKYFKLIIAVDDAKDSGAVQGGAANAERPGN